jgi:hypothetical protein
VLGTELLCKTLLWLPLCRLLLRLRAAGHTIMLLPYHSSLSVSDACVLTHGLSCMAARTHTEQLLMAY